MLDMSMAEVYVAVAAAASFGWGVAWNKSNGLNLAVKFGFYAMAAWGAFITGMASGYIVQIGG